ncbi:hypothetical protein CPC08DRAFT_768962 [Agrocybe pediades]|nr:hypothetical protein CPC08DRAFT_768962 [Agrocybe pediades]
MATIYNDRITTPLKYIEIGENDKLPSEALERECSDGTNKDHSEIILKEPCFITKQPGVPLENVYWVKPVQNNARSQLEVNSKLINSRTSPHVITRDLHDALDSYGFLAVTCSKTTLEALIALVETQNKNWEQRKGRYIRYFDFEKPPFTDATYELVLLYPRHFLAKNGGALTVFSEHGNDSSTGKAYFVSPDGALREGPDDTQPRLPAFSGNTARAPGDMLNPFLVALNAEIAFRRFRERHMAQSPLCKEYDELIDLTIELVNKIYFQPLIDALHRETETLRIIFSGERKGKAAEKDTPRRRRDRAENSRMGVVVSEPSPDASPEEVIKYYRYLMSGCDYIDDSDDDSEVCDDEDDDNASVFQEQQAHYAIAHDVHERELGHA